MSLLLHFSLLCLIYPGLSKCKNLGSNMCTQLHLFRHLFSSQTKGLNYLLSWSAVHFSKMSNLCHTVSSQRFHSVLFQWREKNWSHINRTSKANSEQYTDFKTAHVPRTGERISCVNSLWMPLSSVSAIAVGEHFITTMPSFVYFDMLSDVDSWHILHLDKFSIRMLILYKFPSFS